MIPKIRIWLLLFLLVLGGSAWAAWRQYQQNIHSFSVRRENNPANQRSIDSSIRFLKDGDLVLRTGADAISVMLRQMNQKDKTYSHCGIVFFENGYPFVYHSIGGEDNPDERLRRDSASFFFSPVSNERLGIARLPLNKSQVAKLSRIVQRHYLARIPFDMDFDMATDDRFYCAEFVCKSIQECIGDSTYFGRSKALDRSYVGIDDLTDRRHAKLICDVLYRL